MAEDMKRSHKSIDDFDIIDGGVPRPVFPGTGEFCDLMSIGKIHPLQSESADDPEEYLVTIAGHGRRVISKRGCAMVVGIHQIIGAVYEVEV